MTGTKNYAVLSLEIYILLIITMLNTLSHIFFAIYDLIVSKSLINIPIIIIFSIMFIVLFSMFSLFIRLGGRQKGLNELSVTTSKIFEKPKEILKPIYKPKFTQFYFFHSGFLFLVVVQIISYMRLENIQSLISAIFFTVGLIIVILISLYNYRQYQEAKLDYEM